MKLYQKDLQSFLLVYNLFQNPFGEVKYFFLIFYSNLIKNNNKNKQKQRNYLKNLFYVGEA